jgi:tRNA dimethylallyltransferase
MPVTVAILGPTAVGKSSLGMELAADLKGEIVSADALQAYRGFDLGTAKPSPEEQQRVPHHLIDILDASESFSAGEFARLALEVVQGILDRQRQPLVLGGSGLYLRALLDGISPIPPTSKEIRLALHQRLETEGLAALRTELLELDAATAGRLREGDTQRILRALEVVLSTGRPLSSWLADNPTGHGPLAAIRIGLTLPRNVLYDRIAERVRRMVQAGWVEEVEGLLGRGYSPELPPFQAIGYRELASYIGGETSLEEAVSAIVRATRRYAKRQMTWFRKERAVTWFSMEDPYDCHAAVMDFLRKQGIGGGNDQT